MRCIARVRVLPVCLSFSLIIVRLVRRAHHCSVMMIKLRELLCCRRERFFSPADWGSFSRLAKVITSDLSAVNHLFVVEALDFHEAGGSLTCFVNYLLTLFCPCLQADLFPGALVYFGSDKKMGLFCFCFLNPYFNLLIAVNVWYKTPTLFWCACFLHRLLPKEGIYWIFRLCPASKWVSFKVRLCLLCVAVQVNQVCTLIPQSQQQDIFLLRESCHHWNHLSLCQQVSPHMHTLACTTDSACFSFHLCSCGLFPCLALCLNTQL